MLRVTPVDKISNQVHTFYRGQILEVTDYHYGLTMRINVSEPNATKPEYEYILMVDPKEVEILKCKMCGGPERPDNVLNAQLICQECYEK